MKLTDERGIRTGLWFSNEMLRSDDLCFTGEAEYTNFTSMLASLAYKGKATGDTEDFIIAGLLLEWNNLLTCDLRTGMAVSYSGRYFTTGVWGFVASGGEIFSVVLPKDTSVAFDTGGASDRIDTLEVRPKRTNYDTKARQFKDPVTGSITTSNVDTKTEYACEFQVLKGTGGSGIAPTHTAGWIKVAEVLVVASATSIVQADIKGVSDSDSWTTESNCTKYAQKELSALSLIDSKVTHDILIPSNAELFEYNTPDLVSSKGRQPLGSPICNYFPATLSEDGVDDVHANPWCKWPGRGVTGFFKDKVNRAKDSEDLTGSNWAIASCTKELSNFYIDGKRFTKIINSGANVGYAYQNWVGGWTTLTPSFSVKIKKGNSVGNTTLFTVYNNTIALNSFLLTIDFDNYPNSPGTPSVGILHDYKWINSEVIELKIICATMGALTNDLYIYCHGSNNAIDGEYTYWTAVDAEDNPCPTPYTKSVRPKSDVKFLLSMPSKFTIIFWVRPWFRFDTSIYHRFLEWAFDSTYSFRLYHDIGSDKITIYWHDGGTGRILVTQQFDDGTTYDDINQWIMIAMGIDLTTGTTAGSILKAYADTQVKDTVWSGNIDVKSSEFPILYKGQDYLGANQLDGLMNDFLFVPDEVWTEAQLDAHYTANRPYYADNRILGKNSNYRQDVYGNMHVKRLGVLK